MLWHGEFVMSGSGCGLFIFNEIETVAHIIVISVMAVHLITAVHFEITSKTSTVYSNADIRLAYRRSTIVRQPRG